MADVINTYSGLTAENRTFYERVLLERLKPFLVFQQYGQKKPMPRNQGDKMNFRRFNSLAAATTPLTEGVTPDGSALTVSSIAATVKQYGNYVTISDKLDMAGIDPVLTETAEVLGENAALTIDTVIRDVVCGGTNIQYAGGKASRTALTATDVLTSGEIRKAVRTLRSNNAQPFSDGYFVGIIDPEAAYDLMNDSLWQDISKYSGGVSLMKGEIGKLAGVRFVETSNAKIFAEAGASSIDVHCAMIIGADAYGVPEIDGSSQPEMIVKTFGSAGASDPLNQRATSGWKAMFAAVRLQELSMVRIECGVSA